MGLRFDPVGGGQFKQAVAAIIEAERVPLKQLEARKEKEDAKLKLFNEFKTKVQALANAVDEISTFKRLRELKAELGDGASQMSVTIDKEFANPGQYLIEIDSLAQSGSIMSTGIEDPKEPFGSGTITLFNEDGDTFDYTIDEANSTLTGIAMIINSTPHSPAHAEVIKDASSPDAPWKLIIKSRETEDGLKIADVDFGIGGADFGIDDSQDPQNADLLIDNYEIEASGNEIANFLPGVNVKLKQANPDHPFTLTIVEDYQKITGKVKAMVDQINSVLSFITKQNTVDDRTDTTVTFTGDSSLQLIEYRLRSLVHQPYNVAYEDEDDHFMTLHELGISFEKNGQLSFKEDKFTSLAEKDFDRVARFFTLENNFSERLKDFVFGMTRSNDGILQTKERAIKSKLKNYDQLIDDKSRILDKRRQDLVEKFARLEGSLANMQRQQQSITATLGTGSLMPGLG